MSALRYIGRKRHDVAEDKLFSSDVHYLSNGGIVLSRSATGDDYFRLRVPDTDCPPLPRPAEPLDDGRVDTAEPNRWVIGGVVNTSNGWTFNPENVWDPRNIVYHYVKTSYPCYSSGLIGPGDGRGVVAYFSTTYQGRDPMPPDGPQYRYLMGIVDVCYLSFGGVSIGVMSIYYSYRDSSYLPPADDPSSLSPVHDRHFTRTSHFGLALRSGSGPWAFSIMNYLPTGTRPEHAGQFYLALVFPAGVASGYIGQIFLRHPEGYYYKAAEIPLVGVNAGTPVEVGRAVIPYGTFDSYPAELARLPGSYTCRAIRTQYPPGASTQATLITKVHDLGQARELVPATFPDNVPLIWRASNTPFNAGDATPSWTSPTGEYRYWQFQIPNFSDHGRLVERIELNLASPNDTDPDDGDPTDSDDGNTGDGGSADGGTGPGDDTPVEDPEEATTPLPRNVGIYYTFGDLSASYYGSTIRLPASLLMALNINNDWRAYSTVDLGSSALADEESRRRLYDEYIGYLQSGRHGQSVEIPYPVDSVGGLRGALMMKLSAALLFAGREILDNVNKPDIEAQLAAYIKDYLGTIEWVSSSTVSVTVSSGHINIDCLVSIYDQVERISLSISGG
jgi:hypothetical protein